MSEPTSDPKVYATISHRWGGNNECLTTKTSLPQRISGIPWNELPVSFQDAATVAWEQGIRYLWIDSLCIIQDDSADWEWHAKNMCYIYENSILNIGLTSSPDNTVSCLGRRWLDRTGGVSVESKSISVRIQGKDHVFHSRVPLHLAHRTFDHRSPSDTRGAHVEDDILVQEAAPLLTRGWVFQERMLAPRMVHFHISEMVWECRTATLCECSGINMDRPNDDLKKAIGVNDSPPLSPDFSQHPKSVVVSLAVQRSWARAVAQYTRLRLTRNSDRLAALAGLARQAKRLSGFDYLAGLLFEDKSDFARQLAWHTQKKLPRL